MLGLRSSSVVSDFDSFEKLTYMLTITPDRVYHPGKTVTSLLSHWLRMFEGCPRSDYMERQPLSRRYINLTRQHSSHPCAFGGLRLRLSLILAIETLNVENKHLASGDHRIGRQQVLETVLDMNCDTPGNQCRIDSALLRLALLAYRLQEAAGEPHPTLRPSVPCPPASSFPVCQNRYVSQVPIPLRSSGQAGVAELLWIKWLKDLSRSEAAQEGPSIWAGYYLYRNYLHWDLRIDQPMRDVELRFDKSETRYVNIHGSGTDQHGRFGLRGTINWDTLRFSILKQYLGAHAFRWLGVLTPFGMVGTWHQPRAQDRDDEVGDDDPDPADDPHRVSLGSFWLWRCHPEPYPRPAYD